MATQPRDPLAVGNFGLPVFALPLSFAAPAASEPAELALALVLVLVF